MLEQRVTDKETPRPETPGLYVGRRILALLIDIALLVSLLFIAADLGSIALYPAWWFFDFPLPLFLTRIVEMLVAYPDLNVVLLRAFVLAIIWMYFTILEGYRGQSIGKMILRIHIVDVSGARMIPHTAAIRALTKVLILPIDVIIGLIKSRKAGFLRFFGQYTRSWVVKT